MKIRRLIVWAAGAALLAGAMYLWRTRVVQAQGPSPLSRVAGLFYAPAYNQWQARLSAGNSATGSQTISIVSATVSLPDGRVIIPFNTTAPLLVDIGANQETVTPTAVSNCAYGAQIGQCQVTASFANVHGAGATAASGSAGLQEAVNDANAAGGGVVVVDNTFQGSTATITARTSFSAVNIMDVRGAGPVFYSKSGSGYAQAHLTTAAANNDFVGTVTLASGSATKTFSQAYSSAPVCIGTDQTAANAVKISSTTTAATFTGTTSDVIAYVCIGNPN